MFIFCSSKVFLDKNGYKILNIYFYYISCVEMDHNGIRKTETGYFEKLGDLYLKKIKNRDPNNYRRYNFGS